MTTLIQKPWFKVLSVLCWVAMLVGLAIGLNSPMVAVVLVVIPILHEIGHAIPGVLFYKVPAKLVLLPFGLAVDFDEKHYSKLSADQAATILVSGVLVNTLLALCLLVLIANGNSDFLVFFALVINIMLALSNILPLKMVDGGLLAKAILWPMRSALRTLFVAIWSLSFISIALFFWSAGFVFASALAIVAVLGVVYYGIFAKQSLDEKPKVTVLAAHAMLVSLLLFVNLYMGLWILHMAQAM